MTQEWGSVSSDFESNIIRHIEDPNLIQILRELSRNNHFNDFYIKYKIVEFFTDRQSRLWRIYTLTLSYSPTEYRNFIDISFNKCVNQNNSYYDVEHCIHPGEQDEQEYRRFSGFQGVKEFVLERMNFNEENFRDRRLPTDPAPASALAWNAMDRLLDLLAQ